MTVPVSGLLEGWFPLPGLPWIPRLCFLLLAPPLTFKAPSPKLIISNEFNLGYYHFLEAHNTFLELSSWKNVCFSEQIKSVDEVSKHNYLHAKGEYCLYYTVAIRNFQIWVWVWDRVRVQISNLKPVTSPEPLLFHVVYQHITKSRLLFEIGKV